MRIKIATTLLISVFGISYAGNFISFIDTESKIASKTNTKQEYSEWGNIDEPYQCTEWTPSADTIELETSFEQSRECLQDQERSLSTYNVYSNGVEKLAQSSIENQTVSMTDTQNALGTMPMIPWTQQAKLMASDAETKDYFGRSVSISGDTAIVGADYENTGGVDAGAAYIYTRNGTSWTQQAKLMASDAEDNDYFGRSVSISGDTAIVGAYYENTGGVDAGAAYIYTRNGTSWTQQAKIMANDAETNDYFGRSVSISGDTAIVGADYENTGGVDAGAAYIYTRNGTSWTQQAKLMASDAETKDYFGRSVSISGDTAIVGAYYENTGGVDAGAAYIYTRNGTSWTQQAKIMANDAEASDNFGGSVSISGDTAIVGAIYEDTGGSNAGAAYIYTRNGTSWTQQAKLMASDAETKDYFGRSVSISGDTAIVGAYYENTGGVDAGAAYIYTRNGTSWTQQAKIMANDAEASDNFGGSVSISGDTAIVGAIYEDTGGSNAGAAYIFTP